MNGLLLFVLLAPLAQAPGSAEEIQFNRDIRPILSDNCFHCHGPDKNKRAAGLRLDTPGGGKKAVVPGKPADSPLIHRITSNDPTERMPPAKSGRALTPKQTDLLKQWIAGGAKWEEHWAFLPPKPHAAPAVKNAAWPRNPIDAFILARLEREGISPSAEADKATLLRRVTLDLTGLPPSPAEVDAFLADTAPDAYERVVDRLLASPRYGERMVLEWLDAARYADSNGYQQDRTRTMWPWRDWVVKALNDNMPFDRFTLEQIAGDLLPGATIDSRLATGFQRNHMLNGEGGRIAEESRVDYVVDRVETTATVWLGLTLGCARCHDHKYDPFSQKDFYGLFAYFNNVSESGAVDRGGNAAPVMAMPTPAQTERINTLTKSQGELEKKLKELDHTLLARQAEWERAVAEDPIKLKGDASAAIRVPAEKRNEKQKKALTDAFFAASPERTALAKKADEAKKALKDANDSVLQVMVMDERPKARDSFVLIRGAFDKPGEKVSPGVPALLGKPPADAPANRLGLAKWLIDPANPLTARVTVNRHWQVFFGAGLVRTPEDFGVQGEQPTHPELLDRLATDFVRGGWNVKALHRLIVTSATYRQSSRARAELLERDPADKLLARMARPRLSAFALRDQALAISGLLVEKVGGPPVQPYQPPGIWEEFSFGKISYTQDKGEKLYRRSLYTYWRRTVAPPTMFDTASRQVCTVRPSRTNTPLHALTLLNETAFVEAARAAAQRVMLAEPTAEGRIALLFKLATARKPTAAEAAVLRGALDRLMKRYKADPAAARQLLSVGESRRDETLDVGEHAAWTGLANLVMNLDEAVSRN